MAITKLVRITNEAFNISNAAYGNSNYSLIWIINNIWLKSELGHRIIWINISSWQRRVRTILIEYSCDNSRPRNSYLIARRVRSSLDHFLHENASSQSVSSVKPSFSQDFRLCVASLRCSLGHQSGAVSRPRDFLASEFPRMWRRTFPPGESLTWHLGPFNRLVTLMRLNSFREITLFYK